MQNNWGAQIAKNIQTKLANTFATSRVDQIVLEKSPHVGGLWRHGNSFSRVNSSEPSYRLHIERRVANTNHSYHHEIMADVYHLIMQHDLAQHIFLQKRR